LEVKVISEIFSNSLINCYLGSSDVGIYSVSVSIAELLWYLPNSVGFIIFPKAAASGKMEMRYFTKRVFSITLLLTFIGAIGLALIGKYLIIFVYSISFVSAYTPLLILLPGVVLLGGAKVLSNEMAGRGYPQLNSYVSGLSFIITIVLDLLLVPPMGIIGAAYASTFSYGFSFIVTGGLFIFLEKKEKSREQSFINF